MVASDSGSIRMYQGALRRQRGEKATAERCRVPAGPPQGVYPAEAAAWMVTVLVVFAGAPLREM